MQKLTAFVLVASLVVVGLGGWALARSKPARAVVTHQHEDVAEGRAARRREAALRARTVSALVPSPAEAREELERNVERVVRERVARVRTRANLQNYLEEVAQVATRNGGATAMEMLPAQAAIDALAGELGREEAERLRAEFSNRMAHLAFDSRKSNHVR